MAHFPKMEIHPGHTGDILIAPSITEDDLRAFHNKHFPGTPLPPQFFYLDNYVEEQYLDEDEDDDLGYYPDGAKRTLTEAQIQIFRHSEIHRMLREDASSQPVRVEQSTNVMRKKKKRRNKKKNSNNIPSSASVMLDHHHQGKRTRDDARFYKKESEKPARRRNTSSPESDVPEPKQSKVVKESLDVSYLVDTATRHDPDEYKSDGEKFTYRRLARDADQIPNVSIELDY